MSDDIQPHPKRQRPVCGARRKRDGQPCQVTALYPNGRCRVHGGATPAGASAPNFVLGRRSKYLPRNMQRQAAEALADPDLLNLKDDVAILDGYLAYLLGTLDTETVVQDWAGLRKLAQPVHEAIFANDREATKETWNRLYLAITEGDREATNWGVARQVIQERRKVVAQEAKRLVDMQQMISAEQAMALFAGLANLVRLNVTDRTALAAIDAGIAALLGGSAEVAHARV